MAHEFPELRTHEPWHGVVGLRDAITLAYQEVEDAWRDTIYASLTRGHSNMPRYKVFARRVTAIETTVEAADADEAADIAAEMDPNDRAWIDSGHSELDDISPISDVSPA